MGFDGGCRHVQFTGNLLVAVAWIDKPQHLPLTLGERAGTDELRHFRVVQQALDEAFVEVGELMTMVLVNFTQNALGAVLVQLRQRIQLNQLAQLLGHRFAFNHKVADKPGAVGELERFQQHALGFILITRLPVQLVEQQQVAVEIAHQAQPTGILIQLFEHHFSRVELAQQNLRAGDVTPLALQEVVVGELRFRRVAQPVSRRFFIADHLPVDDAHLIRVGDPVAVIGAVAEQIFQTVQVVAGVIQVAARQRALYL